MQDRFVGDVGDFGKYGLLRTLTRGLAGCEQDKPTGYGDGGRALRLGVIWYYVATDGALPSIGPAFNYLNQTTPLHRRIRMCDQELFAVLSSMVAKGDRRIVSVEQSGALPAGTVYVREPINGVLPRSRWLFQAADAVRDCELVFLDPDKGLVFDEGNPNGVSHEHASYQEVAQLWGRGKSLIIYQDASRRDVPTFAHEQCCLLGELLPGSEPIPLVYHRRGPRILWVIPNSQDAEVVGLLRDRIDAFLACCWGTGRHPHFTRVDC